MLGIIHVDMTLEMNRQIDILQVCSMVEMCSINNETGMERIVVVYELDL